MVQLAQERAKLEIDRLLSRKSTKNHTHHQHTVTYFLDCLYDCS